METRFYKIINNRPSIVSVAKSPGMREKIHSEVFHLFYITIVVNNRLPPHYDGNNTSQRHALPDLCTLGADRLRQQVKVLCSAQDHTPVFPVLGNDGEHLRRKVPGHVTGKPVLQLVHDHDYPFVSVLIVGKLAPMGKCFILVTILCITDALGQGILVMQIHGVLEQGSTFSIALTAGENDHALRMEKVRLTVVHIINVLLGSIHKDPEQRRTFYRAPDAATLDPGSPLR